MIRTFARKQHTAHQSARLNIIPPPRKALRVSASPSIGHDFSQIPVQTQSPANPQPAITSQVPAIQQKSFEVSRATDPEEKEADEVARRVVDGHFAEIHGAGRTVSHEAEGSGHTAPEFQSKLNSSKGVGHSLDARTRRTMESRMGGDFSGVKIHTDSAAHDMNESVGAQAFTCGGDVYFDVGKFDPQSRAGKELLAHELTHVVQQKSASRLQLQRKDKIITLIVKKGQNLYRIALEYGTSVEELQKLNKLPTPNIKEGQILKVAVKTSAPRTTKSPKALEGKKEADDIYGNLKRPQYGDYSITEADLDKSIPYTDPMSGTSYTCKVKETFFGIWVSYGIDYAQKGAHAKGKDKYGTDNAFAATIGAPTGALRFMSADDWSKLRIERKVQAYDNHPSWDLCHDLKFQLYPKLNAEFERRVKLLKLDSATALKTLCQ
ncbi:MAG TPA: DUF4157 domain-containing protein [Chthoniobacterales bacterium]|nr:DUF4157 domain-containing protein [Chthoniobacterales bacterium]